MDFQRFHTGPGVDFSGPGHIERVAVTSQRKELLTMQKLTHTTRISAARITKAIMPYGLMLVLAIAANAQTGSLNGISSTVSTFVTWLRLLAGILGVAAIVWGGINMYFSDLGRGMAKVVAGLVGLIIAGYAQSIVDTFFTTTS
jgi:hypothetical protein